VTLGVRHVKIAAAQQVLRRCPEDQEVVGPVAPHLEKGEADRDKRSPCLDAARKPRRLRVLRHIALCGFAAVLACSETAPLQNAVDRGVYSLDPPRGIQIDATPFANFACSFSANGGPRRVELYRLKPPSALWRYFAPRDWEFVTRCETSGEPGTESMIVPAEITRRTAGLPILLVTAWDSIPHQRWGQMERYSVSRENGRVTYTFGRPVEASQIGGFAAVAVSPQRLTR
jgi:hypothetical protein